MSTVLILNTIYPAFQILLFFYVFACIYENSPEWRKKMEQIDRMFNFCRFSECDCDDICETKNVEELPAVEKYENKYLERLRERTLEKDMSNLPFNGEELEMERVIFEELVSKFLGAAEKKELELRTELLNYQMILDDDDDDKLAQYLSDTLCLDEDIDELIEKNREHALNIVREKIAEINGALDELNCLKDVGPNKEEMQKESRERVISKRLETLKNSYIIEKTPLGNVIMCWDEKKKSFVYYSDNTIPYRYLEAVGRKYVLTYNCTTLFFDMELEVKRAEEKIEEEERRKKEEDEEAAKNINNNVPLVGDVKKDVFAKFKNYNKNNSKNTVAAGAAPKSNAISHTPDTTKKNEKVVLKENANRYTNEGKIANFNILKKVDKKVFNKRLEMTFAEFKKMQMQTK